MLCMISLCWGPIESRGVLRGHLEQRPLCPDGAEKADTAQGLYSPSHQPCSSQQQRLWGQVKPRALPSPARTQFLGPIPKAAALSAQENTAEQQHSHTAKARLPLLWPCHSPLIPARLDQAPGRSLWHPQQPSTLCLPQQFWVRRWVKANTDQYFFPPSCSALGQGASARQMPSARTEGAAESC